MFYKQIEIISSGLVMIRWQNQRMVKIVKREIEGRILNILGNEIM